MVIYQCISILRLRETKAAGYKNQCNVWRKITTCLSFECRGSSATKMKLALISCLSALALPFATGLFFDGGATVAAATANTAILGVAIGAKLAGLAGGLALARGSRGSSSRRSSGRSYYRSSRYSHRGKREVSITHTILTFSHRIS